MKEAFKNWYYKYGIIYATDCRSVNVAEELMSEKGIHIVKNKLIISLFTSEYLRNISRKTYVFRARNRKQAVAIMDRYCEIMSPDCLRLK